MIYLDKENVVVPWQSLNRIGAQALGLLEPFQAMKDHTLRVPVGPEEM